MQAGCVKLKLIKAGWQKLDVERGTRMKRIKGFTLIELLVVIAIIAILAAILFPVFASAKKKGLQASCASNLKQLQQAVIQYTDDWNGFTPPLNLFLMYEDGRPAPSDKSQQTGTVLPGPLMKYIKNWTILCCPGEPYHKLDPRIAQRRNAVAVTWTYTINGNMTPAPYDRNKADNCGIHASTVGRASKAIYFVDENTRTGANASAINDALFIWLDRTADYHPGGGSRTYNYNGQKVATGTAQVSYFDGHVGKVAGLLNWDEHKLDLFSSFAAQ